METHMGWQGLQEQGMENFERWYGQRGEKILTKQKGRHGLQSYEMVTLDTRYELQVEGRRHTKAGMVADHGLETLWGRHGLQHRV